MTVTTNYLVTGNGITGSTANAVQALVSGAWTPADTTVAAFLEAANAACVGGGILKLSRGSTYYVRDFPLGVTKANGGKPWVIDAEGAFIVYDAGIANGASNPVCPVESISNAIYSVGSSGDYMPKLTIRGGTWTGARISGNWDNVTGGTEHDCMTFRYIDGIDVIGGRFFDFQQDAITLQDVGVEGGRLLYNYFKDMGDAAMEFRGGGGYEAAHNLVERCRHIVGCKPNITNVHVHHNQGSTFGIGIFGHGTTWVIEKNIVSVATTSDGKDGNTANGIEISDAGGLVAPTAASGFKVLGNTVAARSGASCFLTRSISAHTLTDVLVAQNTFLGGGTGTVNIGNGTGIRIENNPRIDVPSGASAAAVQIASAATGTIVADNTITALGSVRGVSVSGTDCHVRDNTISTATGECVRGQSGSHRLTVRGNTVTTSGAADCIRCDGTDSDASFNRATQGAAGTLGALAMTNTFPQVIGNRVAAAGEAIYLESTTADGVVSGNIGTSGTQGIRNRGDNNVITGNRIKGMTFWGINNVASSDRMLLDGNILTGNGSGALTDAGTATTTGTNITA